MGFSQKAYHPDLYSFLNPGIDGGKRKEPPIILYAYAATIVSKLLNFFISSFSTQLSRCYKMLKLKRAYLTYIVCTFSY